MKATTLSLLVLLVSTLLVATVFADSHRIELLKAGTINSVKLDAGQYQLVLNDQNEAEIYHRKKLLVTAKVEVLPLGSGTPGSISQSRDGAVKEIRLKQERVVFVDFQASAQTGR